MKIDGGSTQNLVQQAQNRLTDAIGSNDGNSLLQTDKGGKSGVAATGDQEKMVSLLQEELEQLTDADTSDEAVCRQGRATKRDRGEKVPGNQADAEEAKSKEAKTKEEGKEVGRDVKSRQSEMTNAKLGDRSDLAQRIGSAKKTSDAKSEAKQPAPETGPARAVFQATTNVEASETAPGLRQLLNPDAPNEEYSDTTIVPPTVLPFRFGQAVSQFSYLLKSFDYAVATLLMQLEKKLGSGEETDADLVLYSLYLPPVVAHAAEQPFILMDRRTDPSPALGETGMIYYPDGQMEPFDVKQNAAVADAAICIALQNNGNFSPVVFDRGMFEVHQAEKKAAGILDAVVGYLNRNAAEADAFTTRELKDFLISHLRENRDKLLRMECLVGVLIERVVCGILDVRLLLRELAGRQVTAATAPRETRAVDGAKTAARPGGAADMLRSLSRGNSTRKVSDYKTPK